MAFDDPQQKRIIELHDGTTLVLAGPGCGKTHILARRVYYARQSGKVAYGDMLCVTFTNRAAREMQLRIADYLGEKPRGLFVGNMHRFCLRFLFANHLLDAETSVMDEDDQKDFLREYAGTETDAQLREFLLKKAFVYQCDNDHPEWVRRCPATELTPDDFNLICRYTRYQADNKLIDYDDILLRTYTALLQPDAERYAMARYRWVQVDEVQDMTPLQIAIVEQLAADGSTVVYFGDEQQAIFRFIGAGGRALNILKTKCGGNILRLSRNYRSPHRIVGMCNDLASRWLAIPRNMLPEASADRATCAGTLTCHAAPAPYLPLLTVWQVKRWAEADPYGDIAVLVRTNREGDEVAAALDSAGIKHFHIAKHDLFHRVPFKTVWAHLALIHQPNNLQAWARLLYQTRAIRTLSGARRLVAALAGEGVNPGALLDFDSDPRLAACDNIKSNPVVRRVAGRFSAAYSDFYQHWRGVYAEGSSSLGEAIDAAARWLCDKGYTAPLERLDYLLKLVNESIVDAETEHGLRAQLERHLYDLLSYTESDLLADHIADERVSVMTVHKAKGLEMNNVLVYDATSAGGTDDDAVRLLYVAFSRARRRLAVGLSDKPSRALASVMHYFNPVERHEIKCAIADATQNGTSFVIQ